MKCLPRPIRRHPPGMSYIQMIKASASELHRAPLEPDPLQGTPDRTRQARETTGAQRLQRTGASLSPCARSVLSDDYGVNYAQNSKRQTNCIHRGGVEATKEASQARSETDAGT